MKKQFIRSACALFLALMMIFSGFTALADEVAPGEVTPAPSPSAGDTEEARDQSEPDDGVLRVYLQSLGDVQALGLTTEGSYAVEGDSGFRFSSGASITIAADKSSLFMEVGGLVIDMGRSVTLTRHAAGDTSSGLYIHGSERDNLYRGDLELTVDGASIRPILKIDIEEYLLGVVPYEMSDSFPLEALKAQAVAARTYAMDRRASAIRRDYDVVDTTNDQVFKGFDPDCENTLLAVQATKGVVGMYKGNFATCYYTASNGGQTAMPNHIWGYEGDYGYLDIRDDPYDLENPSSPVKSMQINSDTGGMDATLKRMLISRMTEQMASMGLSDELRDIELNRILDIEPIEPKFDDGSRLYQKLRFTLEVSARPLVEVEVTPEPTPEATPESDPTATPDAEATDATPEQEPTPEPTPRIEIVPGEREILKDAIEVDLMVFEHFKKQFGMGISVADCELVSVETLFPPEPEPTEGAPEGEDPAADTTPQVEAFPEPTGFIIELRRFGHGVGMSQRGAQQMAGQHGKTWQEILNFYYPHMDLVDMRFAPPELTELNQLPTTFGRERPRPTPKPTPAPLPQLQGGEKYARVELGSKSSTLNVRQTPSTGARIVDILSHEQRVIIMDEMTDESGMLWAHIKTAEFEGYAAKDYLRDE